SSETTRRYVRTKVFCRDRSGICCSANCIRQALWTIPDHRYQKVLADVSAVAPLRSSGPKFPHSNGPCSRRADLIRLMLSAAINCSRLVKRRTEISWCLSKQSPPGFPFAAGELPECARCPSNVMNGAISVGAGQLSHAHKPSQSLLEIQTKSYDGKQ